MAQRFAQLAAEKIIVPSPSVARVAREWAGVAEEKIVVIPNAIDLADWRDAQSTVAAANPRPYPIAFLGRLDPIKDVPTLVRAAAELGSLVHLHIYGEGSDRARIEQTIAETKALVTMHGAVASPQAALSQSGLLVLPSLAEGFGLVLIEAMAAGVPVVATDVAGIRDVVRNEETGLLARPADATSLAATIRRVVEDEELRSRLIANAAIDVRDRFTWDAVLPQYRSLLRF
jgi:glycosyltransferase involved in cell wall biosynthesis